MMIDIESLSPRVRRAMRQAADAMSRGDFIVARDLAKRVTGDHPEFLDGWMMLAEALAETSQFEAGLHAVEQALQHHGADIGLRVQRCKLLMGMGRKADCSDEVSSLLSVNELDPWAQDMLGMLLSMLERIEEAATLYEQLCAAEPGNPENRVNLGMAQLALGRMADARRQAEEALSLAPGFTRALALLANLRTASDEDNHVEKIKNAQQSARNPADYVSLGYALGKELEDLGRWDEAFGAFREAGAVKRRGLNYDPAWADDLVQALVEQQGSAFFAGLSATYDSNRPIFIFGMPRSGSTLVERILGAHPDVIAGGELRDFMDEANLMTGRAPGRLPDAGAIPAMSGIDTDELGRRYVDAVSARVGSAQRFTDKLPLNFFYIGLIARALPSATLVHVTRNPLDTIFSNFKTLFADLNAYSYVMQETARYFAAYHRLMAHWNTVLPGLIHTLSYEDLVGDVEGRTRALLGHCSLSWNERCLEPHRGEAAVTTASAVQVRQPIYGKAVEHWRHYEHLLGDAMRVLDEAGISYR